MSAPTLSDARADGHAVLLQRIADVEHQRDRHIRRLQNMRVSRDFWRQRALAAEFTPSRPDVARELAFLRRDNARLRVRVVALGGSISSGRPLRGVA